MLKTDPQEMDEDFSSLAEHVMNRELYVDSSPTYGKGKLMLWEWFRNFIAVLMTPSF